MRKFGLILFILVLAACPLDDCNENSPVGPSPPTTTTTVSPPVEDPSPPRADQIPNLMSPNYFTFFSATITYDASLGYETRDAFEAQYIVRVIRYMMELGFDTGRIGAQVDGWCDNGVFYLPCGPPIYSDEWRENLIGMLELTARIPGFQIELIPTFTHKSDPRCGQNCLVRLTQEVVKIVKKGKYQHVIWSAFNEFVHPGTREAGNLNTDTLKAVLRALPYPRGMDFPDNGGEGGSWRGVLNSNETRGGPNLSDWVAFHPSRNPEPTVNAYVQTMNLTGKPVFFNETVSWISQFEKGQVNPRRSLYTQGTEREMRKQVERQQQALCDAGSGCSYHALWLFSYDERIDYAPSCPCR